MRLDLGRSLVDDYSVAAEIALRLPRTLELILAATLLALVIGVPAGVYAAVHRGGRFDRVMSAVTALLLAIPVFVLGTLLILLFAQTLRLTPAGGFVPFARDPGQHLALLALPAIAIGKGLAAIVFRMMRASVLDTLSSDHVRTARAKGLSNARILVHHVVRNAFIAGADRARPAHGRAARRHRAGRIRVQLAGPVDAADPRGRGARLSDGGRHRADDLRRCSC